MQTHNTYTCGCGRPKSPKRALCTSCMEMMKQVSDLVPKYYGYNKCSCGKFKWRSSASCDECARKARASDRRTCPRCGGKKSFEATLCRRCWKETANERRKPVDDCAA